MRGRSSSMERTKVVYEAKEEPCLSGSYIRTLVKHLTSKDSLHGDGELKENVTQNGECFINENKNNTQKQPTQHKKQVRRRLHTTRPYQERLLNMAEARKEIVTALKYHRASMKQQESAAQNLDIHTPQEKKPKSRKIQSLYPPAATTTAAATTSAVTNSYSSLSYPPSYWPSSTIAAPPPPSYYDNQDFVLPSQTLGLTLNFQNFNNLDTNIYQKPVSNNSTLSTSSTPSSSSSSAALSVPVGNSSSSDGGLHHAMDDDEMEEIRSLGEQHQIEWNDTVNLVTSARWCSFLKTMEIETEEGDENDGLNQFDQKIEFPSWLINSNESSCLQQNFDHHFSDAYLQDHALPCMDIGEIEAMDGDWLP
ncbi:uncharacterized protein [Rutidosis leptorrhynchoides]|uniref:uncharacterized protein n=1 Tax=Rutidosis leptorrhynchoides TaxID=125765 RepID=UPI003A9A45CE